MARILKKSNRRVKRIGRVIVKRGVGGRLKISESSRTTRSVSNTAPPPPRKPILVDDASDE